MAIPTAARINDGCGLVGSAGDQYSIRIFCSFRLTGTGAGPKYSIRIFLMHWSSRRVRPNQRRLQRFQNILLEYSPVLYRLVQALSGAFNSRSSYEKGERAGRSQHVCRFILIEYFLEPTRGKHPKRKRRQIILIEYSDAAGYCRKRGRLRLHRFPALLQFADQPTIELFQILTSILH